MISTTSKDKPQATARAAEIVREYGAFDGSDRVNGVTHDGQRVWAATGATLVAFDPGSGKTTRTLSCASDAGTPTISDPVARLVAAVQGAGLGVVPLPGASSITAAVSVAGIVTAAAADSGFVFAGFLATRATEREAAVRRLASEPRSVVLLEAPHRIEALAHALAVLGERSVTVARELTKQFEEISTVHAADLPQWFASSPQRTRGEFVLVLHPAVVATESGNEERVLKLLLAELPLKTAVRLTADITGSPRNALYDAALVLKNDGAAG